MILKEKPAKSTRPVVTEKEKGKKGPEIKTIVLKQKWVPNPTGSLPVWYFVESW